VDLSVIATIGFTVAAALGLVGILASSSKKKR
jgi:hypothetical protein